MVRTGITDDRFNQYNCDRNKQGWHDPEKWARGANQGSNQNSYEPKIPSIWSTGTIVEIRRRPIPLEVPPWGQMTSLCAKLRWSRVRPDATWFSVYFRMCCRRSHLLKSSSLPQVSRVDSSQRRRLECFPPRTSAAGLNSFKLHFTEQPQITFTICHLTRHPRRQLSDMVDDTSRSNLAFTGEIWRELPSR
jgi:hypothetical protein